MRYKVFVLAFILMLFLVACGTEDENVTGYVEDDPLSEKEICIYVQNYMKDTYGDDTEVKVTGKYELTHRTYTAPGLDGAPGLWGNKYATIKNGHRYNLEITNPMYDLMVYGTYYDGFTLKYLDTGLTEAFDRELIVDNDYMYKKKEIDMLKDYEVLLSSKFTKFSLYKESSYESSNINTAVYNLYIYSTDYGVINDVLHRLMEITNERYEGYTCVVRAYIFKNEEFYDSFNAEKYNKLKWNDIYNSVKEGTKEYEEKIAELETEYLPKLLIEHYLGKKIAFIAECENFDRNTFMTEGYENVIIIFEGRLAEYRSSLQLKDAEICYGNTKVYSCTR
ncbi:MAG: hypothetical protein IKS98_12700 [Lachnospiraceae bacterium]|nr:hypothetical protein [Lachnospiraceae bacterium]